MKKLIFIGFIAAILSSCVSTPAGKNYFTIAKEHTFDYYFPSAAATRTFSSLDEAYDYIKCAQIKLSYSADKNYAKGLIATLSGPEVVGDKPVTVTYFILAQNKDKSIDLSKIKDPLETVLREAISVSSVFMVFNSDRGISISDFLIKSGYRYSTNAQYKDFKFNKNLYKTSYPIGWGIDNAFKYLNKEIE